jgi:4-amino-4-deoxy-L-arabinose transferase-like glycosyltransferase
MEDLQPLEAYFDDQAQNWTRMGAVAGVAFGALAAAAAYAWGRPLAGLSLETTAVLVLLVAGSIFGFAWAARMKSAIQRVTRDVYFGNAPFAVQPPKGRYSHRLPASWRTSDRFAVGGVLFVGQGTLAFVPHARNLPKHRTPVFITCGKDTRIDTEPQPMTAVRRILFSRLPDTIRVSNRQSEWRFIVPRAGEIVDRIRRVVAPVET